MIKDGKILIGKSGDEDIYIYPRMANRHGMIAGATGTGKTVTLKVMAEAFSNMGVPVFLADVKGDLASLCEAGSASESVNSRIESMGLTDFTFQKFPVNFWDIYQEKGLPLRTTISEMGPLLLGRILDLNDVQADVLTMIFKIADDEGKILTDTKDLKAMVEYVNENRKDYGVTYGNMAQATLAAITRAVIAIETEGAEKFFGEPALNVKDWLKTDYNGKGMIQVLDCQKLSLNPKMYSMFMLWMLSELFELLPEVGDLEKPRIVFFFDEAHMLFETASKTLLEKIEQIVKLIRSRGVGIYFVTQNPKDIPDGVLAQLGNKVEHALHAYTPAEQKSAKAAAQGFRVNPEFDTYTVLQELGTGEALVSVLGEDGVPTIVKRAKILPPQSSLGTIGDETRKSIINNSDLYMTYHDSVDNYSAYEMLAERLTKVEAEVPATVTAAAAAVTGTETAVAEENLTATQKKQKEIAEKKTTKSTLQKATTKAVKNVASTTVGTVGRELGKNLGSTIGGSFGKTLGGNVGSSIGRNLVGILFSGK